MAESVKMLWLKPVEGTIHGAPIEKHMKLVDGPEQKKEKGYFEVNLYPQPYKEAFYMQQCMYFARIVVAIHSAATNDK
jgi:hypothetical protein